MYVCMYVCMYVRMYIQMDIVDMSSYVYLFKYIYLSCMRACDLHPRTYSPRLNKPQKHDEHKIQTQHMYKSTHQDYNQTESETNHRHVQHCTNTLTLHKPLVPSLQLALSLSLSHVPLSSDASTLTLPKPPVPSLQLSLSLSLFLSPTCH